MTVDPRFETGAGLAQRLAELERRLASLEAKGSTLAYINIMEIVLDGGSFLVEPTIVLDGGTFLQGGDFPIDMGGFVA